MKTLIDEQYPWMISIGNHVRITEGVKILTHDYSWSVLKNYRGGVFGASGTVEIGDNVFIGMNAIIERNVKIGNNVIIGAGSVVTKDCKENSVYAGVPAKRIMGIDEFFMKRRDKQLDDVKVLFQDGYGIESTFAAEPRKLARILGRYYLLDDSVHTTIETYISETSSDFSRRVRDITDTELYGEFENHFNRQIKNRSGRTYRSLQFRDVLAVISSNNIQYIMTKGIMNKYLKAIHDKIVIGFPQTASMTPLDIDSIFTEYYSHINTVDDLLDCHKTILDEIYT